MKFEINRGNELIRRGESIVYNWIFSIEGPRNLYRGGGGARVPGIPNRPYFSIPLWKSENTPIPQGKSWNEPRRHRVIGASILDVTQGRLPSRRLKEETLDPEGYLRIDGRKLNWKPRGAGRHADFHVHFYGGKIISFVISICGVQPDTESFRKIWDAEEEIFLLTEIQGFEYFTQWKKYRMSN